MKVAIFGLGYVGCVSLGCLAKTGVKVIGVDINFTKVNLINSGISTIEEDGLESLISVGVRNDLISATSDTQEALIKSDVAIICVGTPNLPSGHLDMHHIFNVSQEIGEALKVKVNFLTIAIRSTVMPGTNQKVIDIVEAFSGKKHDIDFAVVSNPEFLREGNALDDFFSPPYTVLASECERGVKVLRELYSFIDRPVIQVDVKIAELIKFISNSFHALKVSFANEVGRLCNALNTDSHDLMDLFVSDTDLNISHKYFRPGFSYGGSCLPKDLKALQIIAHDKYLELPILQAIDKSNIVNTQSVYDRLMDFGNVQVGIYGLSFKGGTDDLRFSPSLELVERLIGKGVKVTVFDRNVNTSRLMGKNKDFLFTHLPYANEILENDLSVVLKNSDILLITQIVAPGDVELIRINSQKRLIPILDLARTKEIESLEGYSGISW